MFRALAIRHSLFTVEIQPLSTRLIKPNFCLFLIYARRGMGPMTNDSWTTNQNGGAENSKYVHFNMAGDSNNNIVQKTLHLHGSNSQEEGII